MTTFATPGPIAATVEVGGARVRVTATDRPDTVVRVEPLDPTSRSDAKVADKTKIEYSEGRLLVKTTVAGAKAGSVAITIDLPTGSALAAYLAHSTVDAEGEFGECQLHMASGQARLDRLDALQGSIASGEVTINHITGGTKIDGGAFTLKLSRLDGAGKVTTSGGQAWIGEARTDLELEGASCDFTVDRADGNLTASTARGTVRIAAMTNGRAKLMTGSGDIEIGIGQGTAASLDLNSDRGAVHTFVNPTAEPGPGDAKVSVYARTRHGDITIQRAVAEAHEASVTSTN